MSRRRTFFALKSALIVVLTTASAFAHELERTQVRFRFAADGAFVLEVSNDPEWLLLRLEPYAGTVKPTYRDPQQRDRRLAELSTVFIDRIVLFVDGHEIRPTSADYVAPGTFRMTGRLPSEARTLRWFYGIVIDPYPLTIAFADGSTMKTWVESEAWSGPIDLSRRFRTASGWQQAAPVGIAVAAFLWLVWYRRRERRAKR